MCTLKPPKNYRVIAPKCCATCKTLRFEDNTPLCDRDPKSHYTNCSAGEDIWTGVCDYYKKIKSE